MIYKLKDPKLRAKLIESQNFERNIDLKVSMGVGKINEIKELLDGWYSNIDYLQYKIIDKENIEIYYNPKYIAGVRNEEELKRIKWIIKYVELERFTYESYESTISINSPEKYHYWNIYERHFAYPPHSGRELEKEYYLDISKKIKNSEEVAQIIIKALNEFYEPIKGFEIIKKIT